MRLKRFNLVLEVSKISLADIENHKIMSIDKEKRERILNAAMREFCNGYKKASTDVIVKEAGISKGLLFHYFNTKKELFIFLYNYSINVLMSEFLIKINLNESDILIRLWDMIKLKVELMYIYPDIFDFLIEAQYNTKEGLERDLEIQYKEITNEVYTKLFSNIDTSLFRDNYDIQKVINMITWTLQGYTEKEILINKTSIKECQLNIDKTLKDVEEYMNFFRKLLYKEES